MNTQILIVDDDPNILNAFRRQLRKKFNLDFAEGGTIGIEKIEQHGPYAVVVSDMQMPEVNGLEFLCQVRERHPNTVRMMLTGNADQKTATDAVNEGQIFRFINKPCPSEELSTILSAGLEQHRLIEAEQELLSKTLNGSIELMTDVLSMVNPVAFGRSNRVREIIRKMGSQLNYSNSWRLEIAAALCQIGTVTIPADVLEKSYAGEALEPKDQALIDGHPVVAANLVSRIPRLEEVGTIIKLATAKDSDSEIKELDDSIVESAKLLELVLTFDALTKNYEPSDALAKAAEIPKFTGKSEWLSALAQAATESFEVWSVDVNELNTKMILDRDVRTASGLLLVTQGQQITESMIKRLRNYFEREGLDTKIMVRIPQ